MEGGIAPSITLPVSMGYFSDQVCTFQNDDGGLEVGVNPSRRLFRAKMIAGTTMLTVGCS